MSNYCSKGHWEAGMSLPCKQCQIEQLRAELAEAKQLLSDVRADLVARAEMDAEDGGAVLNISNGLLLRIDALVMPENAPSNNEASSGTSASNAGLGGEWTDPRPQYPARGAIVLVLCEGGRKRYATHEYDGWRKFPGGMVGRWSMADPEIIGWKRANWPPTTDEEKEAAGMEGKSCPAPRNCLHW